MEDAGIAGYQHGVDGESVTNLVMVELRHGLEESNKTPAVEGARVLTCAKRRDATPENADARCRLGPRGDAVMNLAVQGNKGVAGKS